MIATFKCDDSMYTTSLQASNNNYGDVPKAQKKGNLYIVND